MTLTERSLIGSTAAACADRALYNPERLRRAKREIRVTPALPEDVLKIGTCRKCGMFGAHATAGLERPNSRSLRSTLQRLAETKTVAKPDRGRFQAKLSPSTDAAAV